MQRLAIEGRNPYLNRANFDSHLEAGDFRAARTDVSAFQLDKPKVQRIGILAVQPKRYCVNDARARRAGLALKERDLPAVLRLYSG